MIVTVHPVSGPSKSSPGWPYGLKLPVRLRAGVTAVLTILGATTKVVEFQSHDSQLGEIEVPAVRFEACAHNTPAFAYKGTVGAWTDFPFGILLKQRSACVPVELSIVGRAVSPRTVLSIGRRRC